MVAAPDWRGFVVLSGIHGALVRIVRTLWTASQQVLVFACPVLAPTSWLSTRRMPWAQAHTRVTAQRAHQHAAPT